MSCGNCLLHYPSAFWESFSACLLPLYNENPVCPVQHLAHVGNVAHVVTTLADAHAFASSERGVVGTLKPQTGHVMNLTHLFL